MQRNSLALWKVCAVLALSGLAFLLTSHRSFTQQVAAPAQASPGQGKLASLPAPHFKELTGADLPALPELKGLRCFDTEYGWIFTDDPKQARQIAEDTRAAATTFYRHFGIVPGRGAVAVVPAGHALPMQGLQKAGARWVMPWTDLKDALKDSFNEDSIREQVRQQLGNMASEENIEQAIAQVREQLKGDGANATPGLDLYHPLRHELGHVWFIQDVYGQNLIANAPMLQDPLVTHSGGPAPDWLDEAAAILMEDDALTANRRQNFHTFAEMGSDMSKIIPLEKFFKMENPAVKMVADLQQKEGITSSDLTKGTPATLPKVGEVKVLTFTSVEDSAESMEMGMFYEQTRSIIDFLLERTHNPMLFREIAEADKQGLSTADWLAKNGAKYGLPTSVNELEKQWLAWTKKQTK